MYLYSNFYDYKDPVQKNGSFKPVKREHVQQITVDPKAKLRKILKALLTAGYVQLPGTKGSHHQFRKEKKDQTPAHKVTVPVHSGAQRLPIGKTRAIASAVNQSP